MKGVLFTLSSAGALALYLAAFPGCVSSEERAERDTLTSQVGIYSPPPPGIEKARVGVAQFQVISDGQRQPKLDELAGDQMTTLAFQSQRFDVIERAQLEQLLKEQNLEGIVKGPEMAKQAQVRGVDYLIYGKVTNLRVKAEKSATGFGLGRIPIPGAPSALGAFDYRNKESKVTTECGVDIRMVSPTSGKVDAAHFGEFKRIDSIGAIGIDILGANATADADLQISDDDKGKVLRLALDEALRKMLPTVDNVLLARARETKKAEAAAAAAAAPAAVPAAAAPEAGAPKAEPVAAKFCPGCGAKLEAGVKFCPGCGQKISS